MNTDTPLQQEVEELRREIERLRPLVYRDELTGLLNRRGFNEEVEPFFKEVAFEQEHPDMRKRVRIDDFAIIFIDRDNFKRINDTYGHDVGDGALSHIAKLVQGRVRSLDFVSRWGGEEIVIVLLGAGEEEAYRKAEEIREAVTKLQIPGAPDLSVTVSIGVASLSNSQVPNFNTLIARADKAMYEAKTVRGKNTVVKYTEIAEKDTHTPIDQQLSV